MGKTRIRKFCLVCGEIGHMIIQQFYFKGSETLVLNPKFNTKTAWKFTGLIYLERLTNLEEQSRFHKLSSYSARKNMIKVSQNSRNFSKKNLCVGK